MPKQSVSVPQFSDHERFFSKITVVNDCWLYTGGISKNGYGVFAIKNKSYSSHRVSFSIFKSIIGGELVIDHLCRNRKCVNPDHLREVDRKTNTRENNSSPSTVNFYKSACNRGHEYNESNTYFWKNQRRCRVCLKISHTKRNSGLGKGAFNRLKTHCKNGHEYTVENTRIKRTKKGIRRACRSCSLLWIKKGGKNEQ